MRIHGRGGIVQDQDLRLFQQSAGDAQALLLTAGNVAAALLDMGIVAVREAGDEFIGAGQLAGVNQFLVRGVGIAPAQIFLDGAGEERVLLQNHSHVVPEYLQIVILYIYAADPDASLGRIVQSGDQLHQRALGGTGSAQYADGGAAGDVQIHVLQRGPLGLLRVAEGDVFKVDGAVGHIADGVFGRCQIRFLRQDLIAAAQGSLRHGDHNENHGKHHQTAEDLGGIGKHGAELAGGQPQRRVVAGGDHHLGAHPGNDKDTGIYADLHGRSVDRQNVLRFAEIIVDGLGNGLKLADFLVLPNKALDDPDAVNIFLHNGVQPVIGLEYPIEDPENQRNDAQQYKRQKRDGDEVYGAELRADAQGGYRCENEHHRAADGHADHHLECHLNGGDIGGQPCDDRGRRELVDVGKAEILYTVIHVVAHIPRKAGGGLGRIVCGQAAEKQGRQRAQQQLQGLLPDNGHIAHGDAVVIEICHDQRDRYLHGDLADHTDGADQCRPLILAQALGETLYHS